MEFNERNIADRCESFVEQGAWDSLLELLESSAKTPKTSVKQCQWHALALRKLKRPEQALPILLEGIERFPESVPLLKERAVVHYCLGLYDEAESDWQRIYSLRDGRPPPSYFQYMTRIACERKDVLRAIHILSQWESREPRTAKLEIELDRVLRFVGRNVGVLDGEAICALYRLSVSGGQKDLSDNQADAILKAIKWGYLKWPLEIRKIVRGRRVLDVGCGAGTDSLGFLLVGAISYLGLDPTMKPDSRVVKNKRAAKLPGGFTSKEDFGLSPNDLSDIFENISFVRGKFEEIPDDQLGKKFDVVSMYTVTEHLMEIGEVFEGCAGLIVSGGYLVFYHHNFYSWNGHHMAPKRVEDVNPMDAEQQNYLDWNHLTFQPPEGHYFHRGLNKIRLDELRALTEKYFKIIVWNEIPDKTGRLSDDVRARHPKFSRRELEVGKVFCIARKV